MSDERTGQTEERYLTVQEAAEALGVSRATIWRLMGAQKLSARPDPMDARAKMIPVSGINELVRQSAQYARRAALRGTLGKTARLAVA